MRKLLRVLAILVVGLAATFAFAAPAQAAEITYTKTSEWEGGYVIDVVVTNNFSVPVTGWEVAFFLPPGETVTNAWSVQIAADSPYYAMINTSWNAPLEPGESANFGFIVSGSGEPVFLWPMQA